MGHFSSIRFNIRLATLTKFVEFLKSSPVKAGSSEFYFPAWRYASVILCLKFNESRAHTCT